MWRVLLLVMIAVACGPSSTASSTTSSTDPAPTDAGSADCAAAAASLCQKAVACGGDGRASVQLSPGGSAIVYASEAYCRTVFTDQCGPDAPASDVPRVADPSACAHDLMLASCNGRSLVAPSACGGEP